MSDDNDTRHPFSPREDAWPTEPLASRLGGVIRGNVNDLRPQQWVSVPDIAETIAEEVAKRVLAKLAAAGVALTPPASAPDA